MPVSLLAGYEHVRSIACRIAGELAGARNVRLVVQKTGVCSSDILSERGVACCGSAVPRVIQLTAAAKGGCCD
jgi:hypothetical protein